jgi:hypothetical protein
MNSYLNFEIIIFSIIYYYIVIWVMKLFRVYVAYDNYDDFHPPQLPPTLHKLDIHGSWTMAKTIWDKKNWGVIENI